ncbi:MAG: hypothetical protein LC798_12780 [Chloroflexi bacterium]|nr:hypothetical protein [Chloroflexota bacterium]
MDALRGGVRLDREEGVRSAVELIELLGGDITLEREMTLVVLGGAYDELIGAVGRVGDAPRR